MGVTLGHVTSTLFVTHEDVTDGRVEQGVVGGKDAAAGETENGLHMLHLQRLDEGLGPGEFH